MMRATGGRPRPIVGAVGPSALVVAHGAGLATYELGVDDHPGLALYARYKLVHQDLDGSAAYALKILANGG